MIHTTSFEAAALWVVLGIALAGSCMSARRALLSVATGGSLRASAKGQEHPSLMGA